MLATDYHFEAENADTLDHYLLEENVKRSSSRDDDAISSASAEVNEESEDYQYAYYSTRYFTVRV